MREKDEKSNTYVFEVMREREQYWCHVDATKVALVLYGWHRGEYVYKRSESSASFEFNCWVWQKIDLINLHTSNIILFTTNFNVNKSIYIERMNSVDGLLSIVNLID